MKTCALLLIAAFALAACATYDPRIPGSKDPKPFKRGECQVKARDGLWHDCLSIGLP